MEHVSTHFVAVLRRLVTRDWFILILDFDFPLWSISARYYRFTSRIAVCSLFVIGYPKVSSEVQAELRNMFGQLCKDDTPMVRKAAVAALKDFVLVVYYRHQHSYGSGLTRAL